MMVDALERLTPQLRRRIARRLDGLRGELATGWDARHRQHALLSYRASEALGGWDGYRLRYLEPLLRVLAIGIREASPEHLYVYAQERTRFFDQASLDDGGRTELATVLAEDVVETVALFGVGTPEREAVREILAAVHQPLAEESAAAPVRAVMVGDCLMTEIASFVRPQARNVGVDLELEHLYFSAALGRALSAAELVDEFARRPHDVISLSFLTYEGIPPYLALLEEADALTEEELVRTVDRIDAIVREYVGEIRAATNTPILLHGCCGLPLTRRRKFVPLVPPLSKGRRRAVHLLNDRLRELSESIENGIFLDESAAVRETGIRTADRRLVPRTITRKALFHPSVLGTVLARPYVEVFLAFRHLSKTKALLVDFDNTLWKGVMAEGAVDHDVEAQRVLKRLKAAGILLVSVSKNDPESIRWDELELNYDDFVLHKVGWNLKVQSIEEAAHQLDLGLESFVLIDDNPVERDMVASRLPSVRSLDPQKPMTWRHLTMMLSFPNTTITEEATRRTELYREAAARRDALSGGADYPAMMRSLDLTVRFSRAAPDDLDRVHELVSRTNQFNTTTIRRSKGELAKLLNDPHYRVYAGTLSDKFGDLGVVGVSIVRRHAEVLHFESVIMSCRAMGFGFEVVLVRGPIEAETGVRTAVGRYVPTERNRPCAALFEDAGFRLAEDGEWRLNLERSRPEVPDWLAVKTSQ